MTWSYVDTDEINSQPSKGKVRGCIEYRELSSIRHIIGSEPPVYQASDSVVVELGLWQLAYYYVPRYEVGKLGTNPHVRVQGPSRPSIDSLPGFAAHGGMAIPEKVDFINRTRPLFYLSIGS